MKQKTGQNKMIEKIVRFLLGRKYFIGVDESNGEDYFCETEGYYKNGKFYLTKQTLFPPKQDRQGKA